MPLPPVTEIVSPLFAITVAVKATLAPIASAAARFADEPLFTREI